MANTKNGNKINKIKRKTKIGGSSIHETPQAKLPRTFNSPGNKPIFNTPSLPQLVSTSSNEQL
jgi:hypothetical protein